MSNYKLIEKKNKELNYKDFHDWLRRYIKYNVRQFRKRHGKRHRKFR